MTQEEREAKNEAAREQGCLLCPVPGCGDAITWKPFHRTIFESGIIEVDHNGAWPGHEPQKVDGDKAVVVLCEECFGKLTPQQRLAYYEQMLDTRLEKIPTVFKNRTAAGEYVEDNADLARYQRQRFAVEADRAVIRTAVLAGA